jgi:hypothetical protein
LALDPHYSSSPTGKARRISGFVFLENLMNQGVILSFQDEDMSSKSNVTVEMDGNNDGGSAFATLLTDDSFFPGVTALCKSLKATNSGMSQ